MILLIESSIFVDRFRTIVGRCSTFCLHVWFVRKCRQPRKYMKSDVFATSARRKHNFRVNAMQNDTIIIMQLWIQDVVTIFRFCWSGFFQLLAISYGNGTKRLQHRCICKLLRVIAYFCRFRGLKPTSSLKIFCDMQLLDENLLHVTLHWKIQRFVEM